MKKKLNWRKSAALREAPTNGKPRSVTAGNRKSSVRLPALRPRTRLSRSPEPRGSSRHAHFKRYSA